MSMETVNPTIRPPESKRQASDSAATTVTRPLATLAREINKESAAVEQSLKAGLDHARRAGDLLMRAKAQLAHGEWLPWLAANCTLSARTAQAYMRIARNWTELSKYATVADLTFRDGLKLLGEPEQQLKDVDSLFVQALELFQQALEIQKSESPSLEELIEQKRAGEAAAQVAIGLTLDAERELGRRLIEQRSENGRKASGSEGSNA